MALLFTRIDGLQDKCEEFASRLGRYTPYDIPLPYLMSSDTWAVMKNGRMVGGFVIARGFSMRFPSQLSEETIEACPLTKNTPKSTWVEANALWVNEEIDSHMESAQIWWKLRAELLGTGTNCVLIGYMNDNAYVRRFYESIGSLVQKKHVNNDPSKPVLGIVASSRFDISVRGLRIFPVLILKGLTRTRKAAPEFKREKING